MKLATLVLVTTLGLGSAAYADRPAEGLAPRGRLGQLLLERFDRNHDGELGPQERRRAARVLRRLAWKLEMEGHRAARRDRHARGMARRLDAHRDGVVGRDETPPGRVRTLPPLDRHADGMLAPDDLPPGHARQLRPLDRDGDGDNGFDDRDPQ